MSDSPLRDQIETAAYLLRAHGYTVVAPEKQPRAMRPSELRHRIRQQTGINLSSQALCKRLRIPGCPPFTCLTSGTERLLWINVTNELFTFLCQGKQPGRRLVRTS